MKAFLVGVLIAVGLMFSCSMVKGATLDSVLENTVVLGKGICTVPIPKFGMVACECVKGLRTDGAVIYAILFAGEIVAVYEQVGQTTPKMIWDKDWKNV